MSGPTCGNDQGRSGCSGGACNEQDQQAEQDGDPKAKTRGM
jgi:hypothetical protein